MKNNEGITLIALITSVLLLIMLAALTISASLDSYNKVKFEGARSEIEEMEKIVDEIASDYQTYLSEGNENNKTYVDYFKNRYNASDFATKLLSNHKSEAQSLIEKRTELSGSSSNDTEFYFNEDDLEKYFNLKGIDPVVVDFSTRMVYSVKGIKDPNDKNIIYYTPEDWDGSTRVIHIENPKDNLKLQVRKINSIKSVYDIELSITKKLNNIFEIYAYRTTPDTIVKKIEEFRIIECSDAKTVIRFTIDGSGLYVFKVVNDINEGYESDPINLIDEFYFDVIASADTVVFPRTSNTSDFDDILTTEQDVNLTVKNYNGENYNTFETSYEISIVDTSKFSLVDGDKISKKINGNSKINDTVKFKIKIDDLENPSKTLKLKINTTAPYTDTKEIELKVKQDGAIQTINELVDLGNTLRGSNPSSVQNQRFKLTRDLDFNNDSSYDDTSIKSSVTGGNYKPIGEKETCFKGCFNGDNYTISNLSINNNVASICIGLFGYIENATIKNITVNGTINASQMCAMAGIVGQARDSIIDNCKNKANVKMSLGRWQSAGIVGTAIGSTIKNCENSGNISEGNHTAGIVGVVGTSEVNKKTEVLKCKNYGKISNTLGTTAVGGIVGQQSSATSDTLIIDGCENYGEVSVDGNTNNSGDFYEQKVGGILGVVRTNCIIKNCTNNGTMTGHLTKAEFLFNCGGILGRVDEATVLIDNCCNKGHLVGEYRIGGILGHAREGGKAYIINCYNEGIIEEKLQHSASDGGVGYGGIVASLGHNITINMINCYNKSKINGSYHAGGLIGSSENSTGRTISIQNSYNIGEIICKNVSSYYYYYAGGIFGYLSYTKLNLNNVYNSGKVSDNSYGIGYIYNNGSNLTIKNTYYNNVNACNVSGSFTERTDMQQSAFTATLNNNISSIDVNAIKSELISGGLINNSYDIHARKWSFNDQLKCSILSDT